MRTVGRLSDVWVLAEFRSTYETDWVDSHGPQDATTEGKARNAFSCVWYFGGDTVAALPVHSDRP